MHITDCFARLEAWLNGFSIEVFAKTLRQEWTLEVLRETEREGQRDRKLTAPFT